MRKHLTWASAAVSSLRFDKSRVFWVVSVPLAIILGVPFLTDVPAKVKKKWDNKIRDLLNRVLVGSLRGRFVKRMIPESDAGMV
jgi:hypothetical protein